MYNTLHSTECADHMYVQQSTHCTVYVQMTCTLQYTCTVHAVRADHMYNKVHNVRYVQITCTL